MFGLYIYIYGRTGTGMCTVDIYMPMPVRPEVFSWPAGFLWNLGWVYGLHTALCVLGDKIRTHSLEM